jgi:DNA-binding NarL/FixJ family response regulator
MAGKRVLLADDCTLVLNAAAKLVQESFEIVGMVSDGSAAVDAAIALEPDIVVLDISMPGMNGIEVASKLKKCGNEAKIVFLTVHQDTDILETCFAAGALGYVLKVLMESDLIPAINSALAGRQFISDLSSPRN